MEKTTEKVNIGDVVMLKSGGPAMTVMKTFPTNENGQRVELGFFSGVGIAEYQIIENVNVKSLKVVLESEIPEQESQGE